MTVFASELAERRPKEIALTDPLQALTWCQVDNILNRAANALQHLDLGEDQRIAVFAENAVETALANLAGLISGASVVPVNFHLSAEEVAYILNDSKAKLVFVGPETCARGLQAAELSGVHTVIGWRCQQNEQPVDWQTWLAQSSDKEPDTSLKPRPNLLYTSGTTGRPKGTHLPPTMFAGGDTIAEHLNNLKANPLADKGPHLVVGPMYHTGPLSGARLLAAGTPSVILTKFDAEKTLHAIATYQTTSTVMVPTHFIRLLALPEATRQKYNVSSMVRVSHTGSKCPVDIKQAMINWWGPVFLDAYGASEVGTTCMISSQEWLNHPGSVGKSIPPFTAIIVDEDSNELPANTEGKLYFKDATGRGVVYHNDPEKSAAAHIAPGVFTLGEIAYMDEQGYVYITDRFSDMIVSGGVNIYPAEAEQVLLQHPYVLDVACISIPHPEMGEELKALVIPNNNAKIADANEIISFCRDRLSHFKCPRSLDFVRDLGRNTMGKINKRKLRAPLLGGPDVMIEQHIMFIRHGETVANQEHIAHGQRDSLLNDRGQEQARSIGKRLLNWPIPYHRIVSSPLSRARNTAELINRALHLPLNTDPGLIECDLGDWEGISYEELGKHRYAERSIADDHFAEHNGESPAVISARLSHTIERLRCLHPTDNIVLVSHGAAICHAIAALIGSKPLFGYQYLMHNAALSELKLSPEPEIIRLNDYQHLPSHLQSVNKRQAQSQNV